VGVFDASTSPPKEGYAVANDTVIKLIQPGTFNDQLTDVLRNGARALLAQAVEAEVADFLGTHAELKTADGHRRVVRHGHLPEREVMTGIGPVAVRQPRVRDREAGAEDPARIRFSPAILPPYARRSKSLEMLIPILYLKGISTGDFEEALAALLGKDAPGLSASTIARLKEVWVDEHKRWNERDLSAKRYVYVWADGIHLQARLEDDVQCILVIIGATPEGKKELIGFTDGTRESAHDWRTLLLDLKRRGLAIAPELAVADGALGFWKALGEVWPKTREQRCWVHKTANVLNRLPKSQHAKAKRALQEIWMAETKTDADAAFDAFIESYQVKYDKAAGCLEKDREALLAFYDFPAEHWKHLRTTNPIESTFATVRHRTTRSKGCLSNKTARAMVFKLVDGAQKNWRRLDGHNQLPKIIQGVKFTDGLEVVVKPATIQAQTAAA
jgi:putative transposase